MTNNPKKQMKNVAAVAIIMDEEGRVLLTQREEPTSLHDHGKWQFPGGGIEFGEHPAETVYREMIEEIGIKVKVLAEHPFIYSQLHEAHNVHTILLGFPAEYVSGELKANLEENIGDVRWFYLDEIPVVECSPGIKDLAILAVEYKRQNFLSEDSSSTRIVH